MNLITYCIVWALVTLCKSQTDVGSFWNDATDDCVATNWNYEGADQDPNIETLDINCLHGPYGDEPQWMNRSFFTTEEHSILIISFRFWLICSADPAEQGYLEVNGERLFEQSRGTTLESRDACLAPWLAEPFDALSWMGNGNSDCLFLDDAEDQETACYQNISITYPHSGTTPFTLVFGVTTMSGDPDDDEGWGVSDLIIQATFEPTPAPTNQPSSTPTQEPTSPTRTPTAFPTPTDYLNYTFDLYMITEAIDAYTLFLDQFNLTETIMDATKDAIIDGLVPVGDDSHVRNKLEMMIFDINEYANKDALVFEMAVLVGNDPDLYDDVVEEFEDDDDVTAMEEYITEEMVRALNSTDVQIEIDNPSVVTPSTASPESPEPTEPESKNKDSDDGDINTNDIFFIIGVSCMGVALIICCVAAYLVYASRQESAAWTVSKKAPTSSTNEVKKPEPKQTSEPQTEVQSEPVQEIELEPAPQALPKMNDRPRGDTDLIPGSEIAPSEVAGTELNYAVGLGPNALAMGGNLGPTGSRPDEELLGPPGDTNHLPPAPDIDPQFVGVTPLQGGHEDPEEADNNGFTPGGFAPGVGGPGVGPGVGLGPGVGPSVDLGPGGGPGALGPYSGGYNNYGNQYNQMPGGEGPPYN